MKNEYLNILAYYMLISDNNYLPYINYLKEKFEYYITNIENLKEYKFNKIDKKNINLYLKHWKINENKLSNNELKLISFSNLLSNDFLTSNILQIINKRIKIETIKHTDSWQYGLHFLYKKRIKTMSTDKNIIKIFNKAETKFALSQI